MTYDVKMARVRELIDLHNKVLGESTEIDNSHNCVDAGKTLSKLQALGGTTVDRLRRFSFEDVESCLVLVESTGVKSRVIPKILAKEIAETFRDHEETNSGPKSQGSLGSYIGDKKAKRMTPRELVMAYDPAEPDSAAAKRLKEISKDQAFIVFNDANQVDIETTTKLLLELKDNFQPRERIFMGDRVRPIHKIGILPNKFADENPIFHGTRLRPDGSCDKTGRTWAGISLRVKQLVYLAVKLRLLQITTEKANDVIDMVLSDQGDRKFIDRYPQSAVEWDRLNELSNLPAMKLAATSVSTASSSSSPFGEGKRVMPVAR